MAHRKAGGTAKNLRDSQPKFLGIKLADGDRAKAGSILVRQRGTKIIPGTNVRVGKDHTLYAEKSGVVRFTEARKISFTGAATRKKKVSIIEA